MSYSSGWPYAAKAVVQHDVRIENLYVYLTFSLPMNVDLLPNIDKWKVFVNSIQRSADSVEWLDGFTIKIFVETITIPANKVEVSYDGAGPDVWDLDDPARETLETTWRKQWEPWVKILSSAL